MVVRFRIQPSLALTRILMVLAVLSGVLKFRWLATLIWQLQVVRRSPDWVESFGVRLAGTAWRLTGKSFGVHRTRSFGAQLAGSFGVLTGSRQTVSGRSNESCPVSKFQLPQHAPDNPNFAFRWFAKKRDSTLIYPGRLS